MGSLASEIYRQALFFATLPGLGGALCWVAYDLLDRKSDLHENRWRKSILGVLGGTLLATFLGQAISPQPSREIAFSFSLGLCWALVVRVLRGRATKLADIALNARISLGGEGSDGTQNSALDGIDRSDD
jgi:hypothetical protein